MSKLEKLAEELTAEEIEQLKLLNQNKDRIEDLEKERDRLEEKLAEINAELLRLRGGRGAGRRRYRRRGQQPLRDFAIEVLREGRRPMRTGEITDGILEKGYRTRVTDYSRINQMVYAALIKAEEIERVGRGEFRLVDQRPPEKKVILRKRGGETSRVEKPLDEEDDAMTEAANATDAADAEKAGEPLPGMAEPAEGIAKSAED